MKNFKNITNNTIILIILVLIFIFCYLDYKKNYFESFLNPGCSSNSSINGINDTDFKATANFNSIFHGCKNPSTNFYISISGSENYLFDISTNPTANTDTSCQQLADNYTSFDFYTYNNGKCNFYDMCSNIYNTNFKPDISNLLYITCSNDDIQNLNNNFKSLGPGAFINNSYKKIKDNNFKYVSYANNVCANDLKVNSEFDSLEVCLETANQEISLNTRLNDICNCFYLHGKQIINTISNDYNDLFYTNIPKNFVTTETSSELSNNEYINNFYDTIEKHTISEASYNLLLNTNITGGSSAYQSNLDKNDETHIEYKSTHLRTLFVTIILIITIILVVLSITNPTIISVEILISYVTFIILLIFIGSKYFKLFKEDTNTWKKSINQWFQKNILNN
jgi:hypothetical protein